jgi:hypothetical protein
MVATVKLSKWWLQLNQEEPLVQYLPLSLTIIIYEIVQHFVLLYHILQHCTLLYKILCLFYNIHILSII